jgi:hypothetical protein
MKRKFFSYIQNFKIVSGLEAVDGQAKFKKTYGNAQKVAADAHV